MAKASGFISTAELLSELTDDQLAVLEQRARDLARPAVDDKALTAETIHVLTLHMAGEMYAIPVEYVREVRPLVRLTRVPCVPDFVVGVINQRGSILSLIDIRKFFGISGHEITDLLIYIVVQTADVEVGILTYQVGEVVRLPRAEFKSPPATANGVGVEYIEGVSAEGLILLNPEAILGDPRMIVNQESL